jgi:glycosyltransferase involved in cell wall biosynthesis
MAACDYVVLPSTWWENSPVVIQEAYQAKRPVICTGIGGMAEKVIDDVTGLHFERNDAGDLVEKIIDAADPARYRRFQEALPEARSPIWVAQEYAALFDDVIGEAK